MREPKDNEDYKIWFIGEKQYTPFNQNQCMNTPWINREFFLNNLKIENSKWYFFDYEIQRIDYVHEIDHDDGYTNLDYVFFFYRGKLNKKRTFQEHYSNNENMKEMLEFIQKIEFDYSFSQALK